MKSLETLETIGNTVGNTKNHRVVPSKYWCFTLNNWSKTQLETLETLFKTLADAWVIGQEIGESGTPHLQGYVEFKQKVRPVETIGMKEIHWEKRRGTSEQASLYCMKDGNYTQSGINIRAKLVDPLEGLELKPFQKEIIELCKTKPDNRSIYWYYDEEGCAGKTTLAKHICMNYKAIYLSGKAADIKYAITTHLENKDIDVVIFDFVRSSENYISYEAIEAVKNGIFFNNKYESGMCMFNPPHVIILSNFEPDTSKLSKDRWRIKNLNEKINYKLDDFLLMPTDIQILL